MLTVYLALGSNLGSRRENIKSALEEIKLLKSTKVLKSSKIIDSIPLGGPKGQGKFLNAALKISTGLSPFMLLKRLKMIEKELGRAKTVRNGPRVIDIDILLYGDKVIRTKRLCVPHPRMFKRDFVIQPLSEVICG
jgi:dihydroneopterin aldolase/2-amino-4-hydroxy-6-hydroxymethyldihydropteridine diphosphokinase